MLTQEQIVHFETFGFLILRQAFKTREMEQIGSAANELWAAALQRDPAATDLGVAPFIELSPALAWLAADDRLYAPMEQLLGKGFIWSGSEGNNAIAPGPAHDWHADRPGPKELDYRRIKIMLYLSAMKKEEGALRVIPGSQREPLHSALYHFQAVHGQPNPRFFDQCGAEVPCCALETRPGDAAVFSQSLFHGVYGKMPKRCYIALKYAARPAADAQLASLYKYSPYAFEPHASFVNSGSARIRGMVDGLLQLGEKAADLVPQYYP